MAFFTHTVLWNKKTESNDHIIDRKPFENFSSFVIGDNRNKQVEYTVVIPCIPSQ